MEWRKEARTGRWSEMERLEKKAQRTERTDRALPPSLPPCGAGSSTWAAGRIANTGGFSVGWQSWLTPAEQIKDYKRKTLDLQTLPYQVFCSKSNLIRSLFMVQQHQPVNCPQETSPLSFDSNHTARSLKVLAPTFVGLSPYSWPACTRRCRRRFCQRLLGQKCHTVWHLPLNYSIFRTVF